MQTYICNKRQTNRHAIEIPALADTVWEERVPVQLKNLSTSGAYFTARVPFKRGTKVAVTCIICFLPLIPSMCLPRLQGMVVREDLDGFAILLQKNHIISFADFGHFGALFLKKPLPCPLYTSGPWGPDVFKNSPMT